MAKHPTHVVTPALIDDERFSRNGMVPSAPLMKRLAEVFNYAASRCKKQFLSRSQLFSVPESGTSSTVYFWRVRFVLGHGTSAIRIAGGVALTDYAAAAVPTLVFNVYDTSNTLVATKSIATNGLTAGAAVAPGEINHFVIEIEGLTANTEYSLRPSMTEGIRPMYLSVTEADAGFVNDSQTGIANPGAYQAEGPIYDAHISDLIDANNNLWKHNAVSLFNWGAALDEDSGSAPVVSATSYTNVVDAASTTVTAATPGVNLFTLYHNTANRTTVPVKLVAYVARSSGTGTLDIRMTDGTNSISITGTSGAGNQWVTATGTIPVQSGVKWDLQALVSSGVWIVKSVTLFEYET